MGIGLSARQSQIFPLAETADRLAMHSDIWHEHRLLPFRGCKSCSDA
jgi:hypothetical protein